MSLHARNVAVAAGVPTELVEVIVERMIKTKAVNVHSAKEILDELTQKS
jgi:hydroxymethylglutaryl-CoA reductase